MQVVSEANTTPSKTSVRRAGSTVRKHAQGDASDEELEAAVDVIVAYRAQFSEPLVDVNRRLRVMCQGLGVGHDITQRLKKSKTILSKLTREPGLDLSRMQDVGGCRVVVATLADLRRVEAEILRLWNGKVHHIKDYVESPRDSGYRAVHIIVVSQGQQIEIQLRTESMHTWAETVEAFSVVTRENLKQDGSHLVQEFMLTQSKKIAHIEQGKPVPKAILDEADRLSNEVTVYLNALLGGA